MLCDSFFFICFFFDFLRHVAREEGKKEEKTKSINIDRIPLVVLAQVDLQRRFARRHAKGPRKGSRDFVRAFS